MKKFLSAAEQAAESEDLMEFFNSAVDTLQTIVVGLGGALCVWGGINLLAFLSILALGCPEFQDSRLESMSSSMCFLRASLSLEAAVRLSRSALVM